LEIVDPLIVTNEGKVVAVAFYASKNLTLLPPVTTAAEVIVTFEADMYEPVTVKMVLL
jgi:hypothetical protein